MKQARTNLLNIFKNVEIKQNCSYTIANTERKTGSRVKTRKLHNNK